MNDSLPFERRRHPRVVVVKPCKVRDPRTLTFAPAQTSDVSHSGALVRVDRERPFGVGDTIEIGVAWADEAILEGDALRTAVVRRVLPIDHFSQALGIEYTPAEAHATHADAA